MNAESFVYWLQGFVELNGSAPTPEQWQSIKDHLQLVFKKVTPKVDLGLFHKPMMPPAVGPGQTYTPTPLYDPRITCDIRPGEQPQAGDLYTASGDNQGGFTFKEGCDTWTRFDELCKWTDANGR